MQQNLLYHIIFEGTWQAERLRTYLMLLLVADYEMFMLVIFLYT